MLTNMIQGLINGISGACEGIVSLFPPSPFETLNTIAIDNSILQFIAWLVPLPQIITLLEAWGVAIVVFYAQMVIARWIKVLG